MITREVKLSSHVRTNGVPILQMITREVKLSDLVRTISMEIN